MKALLAGLALAACSAAGAAEPVTGEWWTPGFAARVRLMPCGETLCGEIVWLWDEVPDDIADDRPLVGRRIVEGMTRASEDRWEGGRIYNPEDGRSYAASLTLRSADALVVKGCFLLICRKQVWRRAGIEPCPRREAAPAPT